MKKYTHARIDHVMSNYVGKYLLGKHTYYSCNRKYKYLLHMQTKSKFRTHFFKLYPIGTQKTELRIFLIFTGGGGINPHLNIY
jgi:hypothetical protein